MSTTLLFDVDGVFNVWPHPPNITAWQSISRWTEWERATIMGYSITWSTELVSWVNAFTSRDDVNAIWLTTWCENARDVLGPRIGLAESVTWPVLGSVSDDKYAWSGWWKAHHVSDSVVTSTNPDDIVIWIDDDHPIYSRSTLSIRENNPNIHMIAPTSGVGITREMTRYIEYLVS